MEQIWKDAVWKQFGAAIDMLELAIQRCPDNVWSDPAQRPEWQANGVVGFWYLAFHTLFYVDYFLTEDRDNFQPPAPFTCDELSTEGLLPSRPYTKAELQSYLEHCRAKCRRVIREMTGVQCQRTIQIWSKQFNGAELLLYNLRHVQHHTAQLYLLLRQQTATAPNWVSAATCGLDEAHNG